VPTAPVPRPHAARAEVDDAQGRLIELILEGQYAPDSWELYPDVLPTLTELRAAGLSLGVISDWGSNLAPIIAGLGLDQQLDFVLASGAEGMAKPDPAFFRLAAARAAVPIAEALMVGDSYRRRRGRPDGRDGRPPAATSRVARPP
jgi:FMN phosphatase YigB (HAD superfamily)